MASAKNSDSKEKNPTKGPSNKPTGIERAKNILREVVFLSVLVAAVLSARASLADHYYVPSGSMRPTVEEGDHLVVNKLAFGLRIPRTHIYLVSRTGPQRGDVVVLSSPEDGTVLLKRVVAIPGDEIRVDSQGRLILNGQPVEVKQEGDSTLEVLGRSPHSINLTQRPIPSYGPQLLADKYYLVLGDNRGESQDGRNFGLVHKNSILGRGVAIYWRGGKPTWRPFE